jgi:hypothetical protein
MCFNIYFSRTRSVRLRPGGSNMSNPGCKPGVEEPKPLHTTRRVE